MVASDLASDYAIVALSSREGSSTKEPQFRNRASRLIEWGILTPSELLPQRRYDPIESMNGRNYLLFEIRHANRCQTNCRFRFQENLWES